MSDKYYNEDGSIYSFRDKKRHSKSLRKSTLKNNQNINTKRISKSKASLVRLISDTLFYQFVTYVIACLCYKMFLPSLYDTITDIFTIVFLFFSVRCIWLIFKNLMERNLRL